MYNFCINIKIKFKNKCFNSDIGSGYFKVKIKTTTSILVSDEFAFTNGIATKSLQSIFGTVPTYADSICQVKYENSSAYIFAASKDGNNLKIECINAKFTGKKWLNILVFATA